MVGKIDPASQIDPRLAAAPAAGGAASAAGGAGPVKMPSLSQLIQDMQEEVAFAHSERAEEKDIESYECEDYYENLYVYLIERIEKEYPPEDPAHNGRRKVFLDRIRGREASREEIEAALGEASGDSAEQLALLRAAAQDAGVSEQSRERLAGLARDLVRTQGPRMIAGLNTAALARTAAAGGGLEAEKLQAAYQNLVSDYAGILPALAELVDKAGVAGFEDAAGFISRAAERDLAAERASAQPARLGRILSEFQGVKIFNTLREWSNGIVARLEAGAPGERRLKADAFFSRCLRFITHPEQFQSQIAAPLAGLAPARRVVVLQELRAGLHGLPNYLFDNQDQSKARIVFPVQSEIDRLVFEEEA